MTNPSHVPQSPLSLFTKHRTLMHGISTRNWQPMIACGYANTIAESQ